MNNKIGLLLVAGFAIAMMPTASAELTDATKFLHGSDAIATDGCVINVGVCTAASCLASVGTCTGSCAVNVGNCAGHCIVNVGNCARGGNCVVTIGNCGRTPQLVDILAPFTTFAAASPAAPDAAPIPDLPFAGGVPLDGSLPTP